MTNKEILQADVLDILFENRNKAYGAYAIRRTYNNRMAWATGGALAVVLLCSFFITNASKKTVLLNDEKQEYTLTELNVEKEKPKEKEPEKPKEKMAKPEPVASVKITTPVIVDDNKVKDIIPENSESDDKRIDVVNVDGKPDDGKPLQTDTNKKDGDEGLGKKEGNDNSDFIPVSKDASYPGGASAFAQFLSRYLTSPSDLEPGEKKVVLVKFAVDTEGNISQLQILRSGGTEYDREVMRVLKKMPKWVPAEQNGHKVAVNFTQPVTFIGLEQ